MARAYAGSRRRSADMAVRQMECGPDSRTGMSNAARNCNPVWTAPGWFPHVVAGQSRRDCIVQPRVARHELPWEGHVKSAATPTGLHRRCPRVDTTPLGLTGHSNILTRGSSCLATLGLKIESLRDSWVFCLELWVMLSTRRQRGWPQAGRGEPADYLRGVGISRLAAGGVGFAPGMMESSRL